MFDLGGKVYSLSYELFTWLVDDQNVKVKALSWHEQVINVSHSSYVLY